MPRVCLHLLYLVLFNSDVPVPVVSMDVIEALAGAYVDRSRAFASSWSSCGELMVEHGRTLSPESGHY